MSEQPSADQIYAGLNDALLIVDSGHRIVRINPAGEALLGTSGKHLIGRNIGETLEFADPRLTSALTDQEANLAARSVSVFHGGRDLGQVDFDIHTLLADPQWRIVSLTSIRQEGPFSANDATDQSIFSVRAPDILSHEIKNPLAAINGAAQLLDRQLNEDQKPLTQMIKSEVERVVKLLDRMQTLSSNQPAQIQPVNIHSLIDQARQSLETAMKGRIKVGDAFDPSLPDVLIDPDAMMQVLTNLLSNASDAVRDVDKPIIRIITRYSFGASFSSHRNQDAVRLPVEIIVCDNGPGIPKELEQEVFSPFVSTKSEGQGLGLALVKKLMRDMNGQIRYDRSDDLQTRFTLFLPLAPRPAA